MIISGDITIHSAGIHEVHDIPIDVIIRPIKTIIDNKRLDSMMDSLKVFAFFKTLHSFIIITEWCSY